MKSLERILDHKTIERKVIRLAFQVFETFTETDQLLLAGINGNGYEFAKHIHHKLKEIAPFECLLSEVIVNKTNPSENGLMLYPEGDLKKIPVVLVDDVLNTGKTMMHAISFCMKSGSNNIKTLVLADRNHRNYPVYADFSGISLATTLQEHLQFEIENNEMNLYLR
jgi:pyrimidine operon attenuation protein/uracil phosphoribosyltransferase